MDRLVGQPRVHEQLNCTTSALLQSHIQRRLALAEHIAVFTGAGMSAESGVPTFRDRFEGLWAKYDPMDVATPWAFKANPQFVWDWHVQLADTVRKARPNAGHHAVASLQSVVKKVSVITQNIDNLHQAAGSQNVLELHGNLFRLQPFIDEEAAFADGREPIICPVCDGYAAAEYCDPYAGKEDMENIEVVAGPVPRCPRCEARLRPAVVWFGEMLDPMVLEGAMAAIDQCDALICIGSSLEVEPAASLPYRALQRGAVVIEINPSPTTLSARADASLIGPAGEILPMLLQTVWSQATVLPSFDGRE